MQLMTLARRLSDEATEWARQESGEPVLMSTEPFPAGWPAERVEPFMAAFRIEVNDHACGRREYTVTVSETFRR